MYFVNPSFVGFEWCERIPIAKPARVWFYSDPLSLQSLGFASWLGQALVHFQKRWLLRYMGDICKQLQLIWTHHNSFFHKLLLRPESSGHHSHATNLPNYQASLNCWRENHQAPSQDLMNQGLITACRGSVGTMAIMNCF